MPLISSLSAGAKAFGIYALLALSSVVDLFTRSDNATSLGSVKGQNWKVWRGVWGIAANKASSSSSAATNALATLRFTKTDVTVSISGADPGTGASFWVTDADNWYASVYTQNQVCQTCSNCNAWNTPNCVGWAVGNCANGTVCCGGFNTSTCTGNSYTLGPCITWSLGSCITWTLGNCTVWNSANSGNRAPPYGFCFSPSRNPSTCNQRNPSTCNQRNPSTCNQWNASNCNAFCCNGAFENWSPYCTSFSFSCSSFFTFSCNCTTEHRISLISSILGSVSTLSNNLFSSAIQSFKTILSGNQATISAYSTTTYNSQIGNSVVTNITSPTKYTQHGIIKSTSNYSQGSAIDEFGVS
jgi:hypothetical protein